MSGQPDVIVCGAGPWGLASAWRCAADGATVAIVDDGRRPAAHVAAGMLGARAEADAQDPGLLPLLSDALARWPGFSALVAEDAGLPVGDRYPGALLASGRPEHLGAVRRAGQILEAADQPARWLSGSDVRALEPGLSPAVAGALEFPEDGEVDPRRLLSALRAACAARGVETIAGAVASIEAGAARPPSVRLADGARRPAGAVVVAAGHASSQIAPESSIRPVKGQILRLRSPGPPPLTRAIRTPDVYVVPRSDGEIVVGATVEERSDVSVTASAVADLLGDAIRIFPELGEAELVEASAGLRPASADGRPTIGRTAPDGPILAVGGFRHGVVLAPLAAEVVRAEVAGDESSALRAGLGPTVVAKEQESLR